MKLTGKQEALAQIELVKVEGLIPYVNNSRTHDDAQVTQIAASIREFGFTNPVLIDADDGVIAGHGRILAARKLELAEVPCIRLPHLTETQKRAYVIADNKLALNAGWDDELLELEVAGLSEDGFDVALLGFNAGELATLLGLDAGLDGEAPIDAGIGYKEKFAIIVSCEDEAGQQATFERLDSMGFSCKVLVN